MSLTAPGFRTASTNLVHPTGLSTSITPFSSTLMSSIGPGFSAVGSIRLAFRAAALSADWGSLTGREVDASELRSRTSAVSASTAEVEWVHNLRALPPSPTAMTRNSDRFVRHTTGRRPSASSAVRTCIFLIFYLCYGQEANTAACTAFKNQLVQAYDNSRSPCPGYGIEISNTLACCRSCYLNIRGANICSDSKPYVASCERCRPSNRQSRRHGATSSGGHYHSLISWSFSRCSQRCRSASARARLGTQ